jgi:primase-polymerase (primpol)-like protein
MNLSQLSRSRSPDDIVIPDDLGERDQWVLWRYQEVNRRTAKVPYQVGRRRASSTEPGTLASFESVTNEWHSAPNWYAGPGFVFSADDPFCGLDIDDSLDAEGKPKEWARGIVERFADTYMEISPSGKGLKIWARGSLPANLPGVKVGDGQIEMYDHARYFAVTGRAFRGAPLQIEDHISDLRALHDRLTQNKKRWKLEPLVGGRIPYGQQHSTLVSIAGTLRARRVCDEAIEACLQVINARQCEQPGAPEHIARIVRSSRKWGTA